MSPHALLRAPEDSETLGFEVGRVDLTQVGSIEGVNAEAEESFELVIGRCVVDRLDLVNEALQSGWILTDTVLTYGVEPPSLQCRKASSYSVRFLDNSNVVEVRALARGRR